MSAMRRRVMRGPLIAALALTTSVSVVALAGAVDPQFAGKAWGVRKTAGPT